MKQVTLEIYTDLTEEQIELLLKRVATETSDSLDSITGKKHDVEVHQIMIHASDGYELRYTIEAHEEALQPEPE